MFSTILPGLDGIGLELCARYSCLFSTVSSGVLNRTLSHMCSRLHFPMFLVRVGLLTLMKMDSLMVLAR